MHRYRIFIDDEILNIYNDEPIELEDVVKATWMEVRIPYAKNESKRAYLNVAHINRIEVIGE